MCKEGTVISKRILSIPFWLFAALALMAAVAVPAQQWSGDLAGGYLWQNVSGNEQSYLSQYNQKDGFVLEDFNLQYASVKDGPEVFSLRGWGFGGAEPDQHGRLYFHPLPELKVTLTYDGMNSTFNLSNGTFSLEKEAWRMQRWKGAVAWDGLKYVRLTMTLRYLTRTGDQDRPLFGLAKLYPWHVNLDNTMKEAALRIETKTLPVYLSFEQSWAAYENANTWRPGGSNDLSGTSNNLFSVMDTGRVDKQNVPTSRLMGAYRNNVVDIAASFLYSKSTTDVSGTSWTGWDIGGGSIGRLVYLDKILGGAQQDTKVGNLAMAFTLSHNWVFRVSGDYRDANQDSNIAADYQFYFPHPGGPATVIHNPLEGTGNFEVKDTNVSGVLEFHTPKFAVWGGGFSAGRDVTDPAVGADVAPWSVNRTSSGYLVGVSTNLGTKFNASAEYQNGTFEKYVFRTDPESANRLTVRLNSVLGKGWSLGAHGRFEYATNPSEISGRDYRSETYGVSCDWLSAKGTGGFGFNVDRLYLKNDINIILPDRQGELSQYDVDTITAGVRGHLQVGKVDLDANVTRVTDDGKTWPISSWFGDARATLHGPKNLDFSLLVQYRYYNEDLANVDNYEATRYGLVIRWRF